MPLTARRTHAGRAGAMPPPRTDRKVDMQFMKLFAASLLGAAAVVSAAQDVPVGTIIPIMLSTSLDTKKTDLGQTVSARVMDDVPLPDGTKIPEGAKVLGRVVGVTRPNPELGSYLTLVFDRVVFHGQQYAMRANVRALASKMAVFDAQVPLFEEDRVPRSGWMMPQVGGDAAFRPDNPAETWGRFVKFSGDPPPGCGTRVDESHATGALWVFSPYACGTYGFGSDLVIVHDGATAPLGEITLGSRKNVDVHSGSGFLLRVEPAVTNVATGH